jgi:hypothetical protein
MAEQIFKAPGFFEREIDLTVEVQNPTGIPAGVIGTSEKGPAFVPTTVGSFADFNTKFGTLDSKLPAPYAVNLFLKNRFALTFIRTLGAGANETESDIEATRAKGVVVNAGFKLSGSQVNAGVDNRHMHSVQFLTARHVVASTEVAGFPMFSDNDSFFTTGSTTDVNLVRGVLFSASDTRLMVLNTNESFANGVDDFATPDSNLKVKIAISSSAGASFGSTDGNAGIKIVTASFNPTNDDYFAKVLNTDPTKFSVEKHLLYLDMGVDAEVAAVSTGSKSVCIASGSDNVSLNSGDPTLVFRNAFGRFDTRYTTPSSPQIISQPFGLTEYDLFRFETLDDGDYANKKVKVSLANIQASTDPKNPYGKFAVLVRAFDDSDTDPEILEQFNDCNLDPNSDKFIGRVIGDTKVYFNFDVVNEEDRRLVKTGKYPSRSNFIRVVVASAVEDKIAPAKCLPFGFRGVNVLNTNSILTDATSSLSALIRLGASGAVGSTDNRLLSALPPPLPFRFKVTRGAITSAIGPVGTPGPTEIADSRYYWGVKVSRNNNDVLNTNINGEINSVVEAYTAFAGITKLDVLVTGSQADLLNNNKFSLAKVALGNTAVTDLTSSADSHMKEAAYLRNGQPNPSDYKINDTYLNRITFATLLQNNDATTFNRFSNYMKFTTIMVGGWNGLNLLDKEQSAMSDKGTSAETGGGANGSYTSPGFSTNQAGTSRRNNSVASYRVASKLITDPFVSNVNLLTIPGQREPLVTDYATDAVKSYGLAQYLMDIPYYDSSYNRIFDGETGRFVSVNKTADMFESRAVDNEFAAAYFPNVLLEDTVNNNRRVVVPASVAALSALGFNDKVAFPWFAPAGFNRGALDFVKMSQVKVNQPERERLYAVRINPIIKMPGEGFVIFSQQTLEQAGTALQSINVNRMVISLKQQIIAAGNSLIFEQLTPALRQRFVDLVKPILSTVQVRDGIERFEIICDNRNNTQQDNLANRMNASIKVIPVRAAEFISIDFVITNSGIFAA